MRKVAHPSSYLENVASAHRTKSKKTRRSNCLQMSLQRQHFLLSYFTDPKCWSCQDLIQGPPAYTVGLTGRQLNVYKLFILCRVTYKKKVSSVNTEILVKKSQTYWFKLLWSLQINPNDIKFGRQVSLTWQWKKYEKGSFNSRGIRWCTHHFTKQDLHAGHTSFLLNSLVPSSSQKISFHVVKDIEQRILLISNPYPNSWFLVLLATFH